MDLELINNFVKDVKDNKFIQDFVNELSNYLAKETKGKEETLLQEDTNINDLKEENCLYQVIDRGLNGIYLQNTKNNKVFEETDIPQEIQDKIENDYILRYKDGKYIIEEELTDDFFNSLVDIKEYKEIQDKFINESNILELDPDTRFTVDTKQEDYTILSYENNKQIEVPNALLPFFMDCDTILYYKDGKFEKDV